MRSDGVSETLPREPSKTAGAGVIRRLAYSDLPAVISIERRSFPTPWSLAMFVLELSKPSGICLAATEGDRLLGYLVCSRYDQVWHLMNVAVAPERAAELAAAGSIAVAVGDGAVRYRSALEAAGVTVPGDGSPLHRLGAPALLALGRQAPPVRRTDALPDYLRLPDAEVSLRARTSS
jgi:hypothetical protein